ncbi:MAG: TIGR03620 family F420-dependent LLM class oxidoreductase [Acidimicrobiia bacterium]
MMELGRVGIWSGELGLMPAVEMGRTVAIIEELGYRTIWYPESVTKEAFSQAATILAAGDRIIAASGIANIWARDATAMINGARTLGEAYPDRFMLGIGVSHAPTVADRGADYRRPLDAMRSYLDAMAAARYHGPQPAEEPPVMLAALGPRMLRLAAERTRGAHPYFVPVEHTAEARRVMGPDALLAPEQAVVLMSEAEEARAVARKHTSAYLARDNYRNNLLRLGWGEADLSEGASDAAVDAVVAWGDSEAIRDRVAAHLAAGADHVSVQVLTDETGGYPIAELRELTPALAEL